MATRSSSCSSLSMNNVCVSYSNQRLDLPPPLRLNTTLLHHVAVKIGEESINQGIQKLKLRSDFGPPNPNQLSDESSPMRLGSFRLRHPPSAAATHGQTAPFCKPAPPLRQTAPKMMAFERTTFQWGGGIWRSECRRSDEGVLLLRLILDLKTQTQYQIC